MDIIGLDGISKESLEMQLQQGGRFVVYSYCISIIFMTFRRNSSIYYIKPHMSSVGKGLGFTLLSLLFGWWGIPWGPIYTIGALITNFRGGRDVTQEVSYSLTGQSVVTGQRVV
ncbi:hypothetical protein J2T12_003011 [Paenibacillus anaericanus]|uniref:Uncharacterized protein n=1 Tax=Paenibacillus anaericanus TaxID=170367 RepID=A0A433Y1D3_9BACL|nr:hypothetical protein [Paenibacillus anaericanus]MDQ0089599.1 hypothetical protein [Paenibacillus anaericanus]RUT41478.1 hypothetical protein EJP82_23320 [Paenibacillus anaericanus]